MPKYIPTEQELNTIFTAYKAKGTYKAASEASGLSTTIVTRIIKEAKEKESILAAQPANTSTTVDIPEPPMPSASVVYFWCPTEEWRNSYDK